MNKNTQIQTINGNESNTIQKKSKKNKFNKFFTTVSAVMIASSIALSPMTLRADETKDFDQIHHEKIEELKRKNLLTPAQIQKLDDFEKKHEELKKDAIEPRENWEKLAEITFEEKKYIKKVLQEDKLNTEQITLLKQRIEDLNEKIVIIANNYFLIVKELRDLENKTERTYRNKEFEKKIEKEREIAKKEILNKYDEKIKRADEKIKRADEEIAKSQAEIEDAKKKIEEADKKIEENCKGMEKNILLASDYCSKNTCTAEQLNILKETKETYNTECKKLVVKSE
jgi:chromosome segregation ATPase